MRKRFVDQLSFGSLPIGDTPVDPKSKNKLDELLVALLALFKDDEYLEKLMQLLESCVTFNKKKTGRQGMDLWNIFVLSQVRMCLNLSYEELHNYASNHLTLRHLMGLETTWGYERICFGYQQIHDNISFLNKDVVKKINELVLEFGHKKIFKKKPDAGVRLKSDSFAVESNVHFPTDYNLLWDCVRVSVRLIRKFCKKYDHIGEWRKAFDWSRRIKNLMRNLGRASRGGGANKAVRVHYAAENLLKVARSFLAKLEGSLPHFPKQDVWDVITMNMLLEFKGYLIKHIDLVDRRLIKGQEIPHEEKMFSVFETYTEWISKGKRNVELGKKVCITTDADHLIVDYQIMKNEQDRDIIQALCDRVSEKYNILSWSFDKGYWSKENKAILEQKVDTLVLPKLGKRNTSEEAVETSKDFKRLKNKHSTVESNINELEHRGLNRCLDKGEAHFDRYVGLAICAYNLKKMGRKILTAERKKIAAAAKKKSAVNRKAA